MFIRVLAATMVATVFYAGPVSAQCFDYSKLNSQQASMQGLSAASCVGYYAATQEQADPATFAQLKAMGADVADTFEGVTCPSRNITVGRDGEAESKFEVGYDLARANAAMVQNGAMPMIEFRARVGACAEVATHYMREFQKMTR